MDRPVSIGICSPSALRSGKIDCLHPSIINVTVTPTLLLSSHTPSHARRLDSSIGTAKRKALPETRFASGAGRRVSPPSVLSVFHGSESSTTLDMSTCRSSSQNNNTCCRGRGQRTDCGHIFGARRGPHSALRMYRANHQIAEGPQKPQDW